VEKERLRAVGYRRVSMREQVDGHSLDAQAKNIRDYVNGQGWDLLEIYTDAGISAKKDSFRPDLARLMQDAEAGKFDVVVVDKIDRFYRHLAGLLTALDNLRHMNVAFASVQERLDFTSPWGKLTLTVLGILAELYLDNLRQETIKGKKERARKGLWNGMPPYGYCKGLCEACEDPNGKGYCPDFGQPSKTDGKHLVAHPIDSQVVKLAFAWYLEGNASDAIIAEKLNEFFLELPDGEKIQVHQRGHPGVSEPGPFKKDVVRDMLKRVFYTGFLPYKSSSGLGARRTRRSDLASAELYPGQHPVLISMEDYHKAQELRRLQTVTRHTKWSTPAHVFPMSGILYCGYCGSSMRGVSNQNRLYYRDGANIEKTRNCPQHTVRAEKLEASMAEVLKNILAAWDKTHETIDPEEASREIENRFNRARELYLAGDINRDQYQVEKERYEKSKSNLRLEDANVIITLTDSLRTSLNNWDETLPIEKKKLLRTAIRAAFVRGDTLVALQPTDVLWPLTDPIRCQSGEGGRRSKSDNLALFDQSMTDAAAVATFSDMQGKT